VTITVRVLETDADLEAWRTVRMAVIPNERRMTIDQLRAAPSMP
jgi:hypothetical protein